MQLGRWTSTSSTCDGSPYTTTRFVDGIARRRRLVRDRRSSVSGPRRSCASPRPSRVDAAPASFQHAVAHALAAGATTDEIVACLEAVTPVTGAARVVQCAPKLALALGYDVEAALERLDP